MDELVLEKPSMCHEGRAMAYQKEFLAFGEKKIQGACGLADYTDYKDWLAQAARYGDAAASPWGIAATTYFSVHKGSGRIIGTIQLRHSLSEEMKRGGGHIGYSIRPTERGKGYAKQQLRLVLREADRLGLTRVMVSCDKRNVASAAVIRSCGGVLYWEGFSEFFHMFIQIYWIDRRTGIR